MQYECLIFQVEDSIATLTLSRPQALNALNSQLLRECAAAIAAVGADEEIRVLVVTGAGEKAFVAGADIGELNRLSPLAAREFANDGQQVIDSLQRLPVPVIAAVNGYALGGGCELALACDFIYAAEHAAFGLPEINLGIIPGFGGTQRLPRLVGASWARELIFTGRSLSASEAESIGLVNRCLPPDQLLPTVQETARLIARKSRAALAAAKAAIRGGLNCDLLTGLAIERDAFALCFTGGDAGEGTTAFLEKRTAVFSGSRRS